MIRCLICGSEVGSLGCPTKWKHPGPPSPPFTYTVTTTPFDVAALQAKLAAVEAERDQAKAQVALVLGANGKAAMEALSAIQRAERAEARLAAVEAERDGWKTQAGMRRSSDEERVRELEAKLAAVEAERDEARRADDQRTGEWNRAQERAERAEAALTDYKRSMPSPQDMADAVDRAMKAEAALARAREVLETFEWQYHGDPMGWWCYPCGNRRESGHAPDCALKAVLSE